MNKVNDILAIDIDDTELENMSLDDVEVLSVSDALALPETGASSAVSSCKSSSSCGSSSCFEIA